jgi:hypothetical protein
MPTGGALARSERFELPTLGFEVRCSIQLSYERVRGLDYQTWPDWATQRKPGKCVLHDRTRKRAGHHRHSGTDPEKPAGVDVDQCDPSKRCQHLPTNSTPITNCRSSQATGIFYAGCGPFGRAAGWQVFGWRNEQVGGHAEPGAQPLHHRHAQPLLAAQDFADSARIGTMSARVRPCWSIR